MSKWRRFMESLSPELRKKFDGLHAEAAKMDNNKLQRSIQEFIGKLSSEQKKMYDEIQQRGGGMERGRGEGETGGGGEPEGGKAMTEKLDESASRKDLAPATRDALRSIKNIYGRSGLKATQKCEQIQRLLNKISPEDKAKLKVPSDLLTMNCREAGGDGPQNLVEGISRGRH
uniref:SICAvar, type II n=1 Tax=Globodera pallida TaxID=36090 RepID=A0A183BXP4_GLOPA